MFGVSYDGLFADAGFAGEGGVDGGPPPARALSVANGDGFSCALRVDGTVTCWGYNGGDGRLGNATDISSSTPTLVKDVTDGAALAVGGAHACVVRKSGVVSCWGRNEYGGLGDGTTNPSRFPVAVVNLADATQVALGYHFSCAIRKDATVVCWGANGSGQLGDGTTADHRQPLPVQGLTDVTQIAAMERSACALVKSGDVYCWGRNGAGQVGDGTNDDAPTPKKVTGLSGVTSIGAGANANHICAVIGAGDVRCWGLGDNGALGNGSSGSSNKPVIVALVNDAIQVSTGYVTSCSVKKNGTATCWGWNGWRQIGIGDNAPPGQLSTPVPVMNLTDLKQISNGGDHMCAVTTNGRISCWGSDVDGRLGRGTRIMSAEPVQLVGVTGITSLALGNAHGCAVSGGSLSCWGANWDSQLTDDNNIAASGTPLKIPSLSTVATAGAGNDHACVVLGDGTVKCWGYGYYGDLGQGKNNGEGMPVTFGAGPAKAVVGGYHFTCALLQSGEVACSGLNDNARLGHPGGNTNTPARVEIDQTPTYLTGVTTLAAGYSHGCAITGGGDLYCWGASGYGQCGVDANETPPIQVNLSGAKVKLVTAGYAHTCVVLADDTMRCWGANGDGQLTGSGDGTTPKTPSLAKPATSIAAGGSHTCAALNDGTVWCWGNARLGQLGNGSTIGASAPVQVKGITTAVSVHAHDDSTCAVLQDGTAMCWGENPVGELGEGSVFTTGVPGFVVGY